MDCKEFYHEYFMLDSEEGVIYSGNDYSPFDMKIRCRNEYFLQSGNPSLRGGSIPPPSTPNLRGSINSLTTKSVSINDSPGSSMPSAPISQNLGTQNGGGTVSVGDESIEQFQTTTFVDQSQGEVLHYSVRDNILARADIQEDTQLKDYLSRPVMIFDQTWLTSDAAGVGSTIAPWGLYLNTLSINNKLQNYPFIRGKLHLKIIVNASPFYYGSMLMYYTPVGGIWQDNIVVDSTTLSHIMPYSQRPHVWLYPQTNQGGEIVCPFFYHKNWLDVTSLSDVNKFGNLSYMVVNPLTSANGVTGVGVYFSIYAWMEDVELMTTSSSSILQAGKDEYASGPISKPASALSRALDSLSRVPLIGNYATASSMIAKGVGQMASHLGYTNVPEISNVQAYKPQPFPQFASSEISTPIEKFALDPKTELTIDPSTVGLPQEDELSINHICGRESYLTSFSFSTSNTATDVLFRCNVTPFLYQGFNTGTPSATWYNSVPSGYLSNLFDFWRGDIIFRFKIICTQYHKGRVLLMYDPRNYNMGASTESSVVFTEVLDIGAENDIEFRVPYMQATAWQRTLSTVAFSNTGGAISTSGGDNGQFIVRVLNPLTAPVASSTIKVQVFVKCADNFEFNLPKAAYNLETFTLQTGEEISYEEPTQLLTGASPGSHVDERYLHNMGEKITSLRQLLRRTTYLGSSLFQADTTDTILRWRSMHGRFPIFYGWDPNGVQTAIGLTNQPFNFVANSFFQYAALMFIGMRGSMNWNYHFDNQEAELADIRMNRLITTRVAGNYNDQAGTTTVTRNVAARFYLTGLDSGATGMSVTHQSTQAGIAACLPHYSLYNFYYTNPNNMVLGSSVDGSDVDTMITTAVVKPLYATKPVVSITANRYYSIGPDFNFFMFINVPSRTFLTTPNGV